MAQPINAGPASTGELLRELSEQTSLLVRQELKLARLELEEKGKRAGIGTGMFGGAGVVALFGVGALVAGAILGLATAVSAWLAALIVGGALLIVAAAFALFGRAELRRATPAAPEGAIAGVRADVRTVRERAQR